jgi:hypothetical protein
MIGTTSVALAISWIVKRRYPENQIFSLAKQALSPDQNVLRSVDPLGSRRRSLIRLTGMLDRYARKTELQVPGKLVSAVSALLYSAASSLRAYVESRESLSDKLTPDVVLTLRYSLLLAITDPPSAVYFEAADHWKAFDDEGRAVFQRRHTRWSGVGSALSRLGHSLEPAGRPARWLSRQAADMGPCGCVRPPPRRGAGGHPLIGSRARRVPDGGANRGQHGSVRHKRIRRDGATSAGQRS